MSKHNYNWKRFWCPRTGILNLSDGGYLNDPESEYGNIYNPDVVSFESIAEVPCLALLGEPGIGKTETIKAEIREINTKIKEQDDQLIWLDLRSYGSEDRLVRNLFENSTFVSWIKGKHRLHIFLDSLEECMLRINNLPTILLDEFAKHPIERLFLRIACRTVDWPQVLEIGLNELWRRIPKLYFHDQNIVQELLKKKIIEDDISNSRYIYLHNTFSDEELLKDRLNKIDNIDIEPVLGILRQSVEKKVGVYELAPLCHKNVEEAAKVNGIKTNQFMTEIERMQAEPLAIKPITLDFLLKTYLRKSCLYSSKEELYQEGCRVLCEEPNQNRIATGGTGTLSSAQRLAIAARIAVITIFSNRLAVWTNVYMGDIPDEDISVQSLCGNEQFNNNPLVINEAEIIETIGTGLFSSRGSNRMGWAHQTYSEFLAARYLVTHGMTLDQIMSFIVHSGDVEGKLVPQFYETAAWLAGMAPEIFQRIIIADPEVLLKSDVATADIKDRENLIATLLKLYEEEKLLGSNWELSKYYKKLKHPGLADQLKPYILDNTKGIIVRRVAINIAEACNLKELQNDLIEVAINPSHSIQTRKEAVFAVGIIADEEIKIKLRSLIFSGSKDDSDDQLKGYSLRALWPNHITAKELFSILTPSQNQNFIGAYDIFISSELINGLQGSDLPHALKWVEKQESSHKLPYRFVALVDAIMTKAWEFIESPGILKAFAKSAFSRLKHYDTILGDRNDSNSNEKLIDDDIRHMLVKSMIPLLSDIKEAYFLSRIVPSKDVFWMIEQLRSSTSSKNKEIWAKLIARAFDTQNPDQYNAILLACDDCTILAASFQWLRKPIELGSPEAEEMKKNYDIMNRDRDQLPLLDPPPTERIINCLNEIDSGNLASWWILTREMTLQPNSKYYDDDFESDLTTLPGWKNSDPETKARTVLAARRYILEHDPMTHEWLGKNIFHRPDFSGYKAFRLLMQFDPGFIKSISVNLWQKWAPILLAYPTSGGTGEEEPHHELVKLAYKHAPKEIIDALSVMIDKENKESDYIFITQKVDTCWDEQMASFLLNKAKEGEIKPKSMGVLLSQLLNHNSEEAKTFTESIIPLSLPEDENTQKKAIIAAQVLMTNAEGAGWSVVWPIFQHDVEFGKMIILEVAGRNTGNLLQHLSGKQLADLFIWLENQYPRKKDPKHEGAYFAGPRDEIASLRDSILQHLQNHGTNEACIAIKHIIDELPQLSDRLKWTLQEAQNITRRNTWTPLSPNEVIEKIMQPQKEIGSQSNINIGKQEAGNIYNVVINNPEKIK